jgi:hypothetical protein
MVRHRVSFACLLAIGLLAPSCDESQAPPRDGAAAYQGQFDAASGAFELALGTPHGDLAALRLVVTDIVVDAANHRVQAAVAIRNVGGLVVPGPSGIEVDAFVPDDVAPVNAACIVCVTTPCPASCVFDHTGTYGDDGVLAPHETSTPVEWIFHNPSNESFAFRARIAVDPTPNGGIIAGTVFRDMDGDGTRDDGEPGLAGAPITLEGDFGAQLSVSGGDGRYGFRVQAPGLYELIFGCPGCGAPPYPCVLTTPERRQVLVIRRPDGTLSSFERGDFGCAPREPGMWQAAGVVFEDLDRNGVRDSTERGLAGIRIVAQSVLCDVPTLEVVTDLRGAYRIALPGCAPWTVGHETPLGFMDTTPNPVTLPRERRLPGDPIPSPNVFWVDFGMTPTPRR